MPRRLVVGLTNTGNCSGIAACVPQARPWDFATSSLLYTQLRCQSCSSPNKAVIGGDGDRRGDDDPSGIATYSQAGAQFGFRLGWTLVLTFPLMMVIQVSAW